MTLRFLALSPSNMMARASGWEAARSLCPSRWTLHPPPLPPSTRQGKVNLCRARSRSGRALSEERSSARNLGSAWFTTSTFLSSEGKGGEGDLNEGGDGGLATRDVGGVREGRVEPVAEEALAHGRAGEVQGPHQAPGLPAHHPQVLQCHAVQHQSASRPPPLPRLPTFTRPPVLSSRPFKKVVT